MNSIATNRRQEPSGTRARKGDQKEIAMTAQEIREHNESVDAFRKFFPKAVAFAAVIAWTLPSVVAFFR
jgi:hypothetical protein